MQRKYKLRNAGNSQEFQVLKERIKWKSKREKHTTLYACMNSHRKERRRMLKPVQETGGSWGFRAAFCSYPIWELIL